LALLSKLSDYFDPFLAKSERGSFKSKSVLSLLACPRLTNKISQDMFQFV